MNWNNLFEYKAGNLYWKISPHPRLPIGSKAGSFNGRSWYVEVKQKNYQLHRVVWEMINGRIPEGFTIDHIDRNPSNNNLNNLRLATHQQNCSNRGVRRDSKSRIKGVYWEKRKNRWISSIQGKGKKKYLGMFICPLQASLVYQDAAMANSKHRNKLVPYPHRW